MMKPGFSMRIAFGVATAASITSLAAPVGTAFTYQGQLKQGGAPLDGAVAMTFQLFDAPTAGASVGSLLSSPAVSVVNGLFTVTLDFGAVAFNGNARWLQIVVNGQTLSPRQPINATPYAARALDAPHGHSLDAADGSPVDALFVNNSGFVGIGTTAPGVPIDAVGSSQTMLSLSSSHTGGTWLNLSNTNPGGKGWNLITTGPGNGEGTGHLLFRNGTDSSVVMTLTYDGKTYLRSELVVDQGNTNIGTVAGGLRFGFNSGEAIASKRSSGGNQYGLDFYTSSLPRVSIAGNGNVGIGTTSPAAPLDIAVGDKRFQIRSDGGLVPGINLTGTGGNLGILRIRNAIEMWPDDGGTRAGKIGLVNAASTAFTISLDGGNGTIAANGDMVVDGSGANPGTTASNVLRFGGGGVGEAIASKRTSGGNRYGLDFYTAYAPRLSITNGGYVGIGLTNPSVRLEVAGAGDTEFGIMSTDSGGRLWTLQSSRADGGPFDGIFQIIDRSAGASRMTITPGGNVGVGTTAPQALLDVNGRTRTKSLEIVGGADLAEPIDVDGDVEPGAVVVIDAEHPGHFKVAAQPYDRKVAGVISGANGLAPGMVMRVEGDAATNGRHPLALSGRVWCRCDAAYGAITPGDLLTTSATTGHAMRVSDDKDAPRGCIIGKAMTPLTEGKGLVLVLVNLQ